MKNNGPAQSAIPTTMSENPSTTAVKRPIQAITQKTRRNGSVVTNQSTASVETNICPNNHELDGFLSRVRGSNRLSVRRCVRRVRGSLTHHRLVADCQVVSDWACFILPSR